MTAPHAIFRERVPLATISAISGEALSAYLAAKGWERTGPWADGGDRWDLPGAVGGGVVVPWATGRGRNHRLAECVQDLADISESSVWAVLADLGVVDGAARKRPA